MPLTRAAVLPTGNAIAIGPHCSAADAPRPSLAGFGDASRTRAPTAMTEPLPFTEPLKQAEKTADSKNRPLVVVGGGVSGVWAAITLRELG